MRLVFLQLSKHRNVQPIGYTFSLSGVTITDSLNSLRLDTNRNRAVALTKLRHCDDLEIIRPTLARR